MESLLISDNLPADLMLEILLVLPAKSLLRFKCISKSWFALITSNQFMNMRDSEKESILTVARTNHLSFSLISRYNESYSVHYWDVDFPHNDQLRYKQLLGCDGIVLESNNFLGPYFLHNLTTKETVALPETGVLEDPHHYETDYASLGFGYDLKHLNYKVVKTGDYSYDIKTCDDDIQYFYFVQVYTLGTDSWRRVTDKGNFNYKGIGKLRGPGFYFNGAIHWHGWHPNYEDIVISFDLGDEAFQVVTELPEGYKWESSGTYMQFLVWNGCLGVSAVREGKLDILVMKEYGVKESWTKFSIQPGPFSYNRAPLAVWKDNELLLEVLDDDTDEFNWVSYNPNKQEFKNVENEVNVGRTAFVYKENFVSIKWRRELYLKKCRKPIYVLIYG